MDQPSIRLATQGILLLQHVATADEQRRVCLYLMRHTDTFLPSCETSSGYDLNRAVLDILMCQPCDRDVTSKFTALLRFLSSFKLAAGKFQLPLSLCGGQLPVMPPNKVYM